MGEIDYAKMVNFIDRNAAKIKAGGNGSPYDGETNYYSIGNKFICKNIWSMDKDEYEFTFNGVTVKGGYAEGIYEQVKMLYRDAHSEEIKKGRDISQRLKSFHQPIGDKF